MGPQRVKYKVDENNRLVIERAGEELFPEGRFVIDRDNKLSYVISSPEIWRKRYELPNKIAFEGKWQLDENHDLLFALNRARRQYGTDKLYLKTELVAAREDALAFSMGSTQERGIGQVQLLELKGRWQSDEHNRLQFLVKKSATRYDTLTFQGAWDVDRDNSLVYTYKKTFLKRKEVLENTLTFEGYWQLDAKNRIGYILGLDNNSLFNFRAQLETPSLSGKSGAIQYRAGIGVKTKAPFVSRVFTLYGVWKFQKKLGLSFEMDYAQGRVGELRFGAVAQTLKGPEVTFQLTNAEGKDLGISVTFSRNFLKDKAAWFLRLAGSDRESKVEGGIVIPW